MRQRSDTWIKLAARGNFRMESIAIINGVEYTAISAPLINRALFADNLSVGNCISATLKLSVLTDDVIGKSAKVVIKGRITDDVLYSEWMEFGTFYIDNRTSNSGLVTIQCYDSMLKASQQYGDETNPEDRIGWPKTMKACVTEIAARIGVEIDPRTVIKTTDPYQVPYPAKLTMMQVLGYIGACHGGNWIITPENKLRLVPLLSPPAETFNIIDHDYNPIYTGDGHRLVWQHTESGETVEHKAGGGLINVPVVLGKIETSRGFAISSVIITRDEDLGYALGDDSGYTIIIEGNPYACQAICDDLYAELNGIEYYPYTITAACYDPAAELGDWILVGDKVRSVLWSVNATFNTDLRINASAPGHDEVGSEYPYLTSIQRLQMENEQLKKYTETEKDEIYSKIEQTHTDILIAVSGTYATQQSVSASFKVTTDALTAEVTRAKGEEEKLSSSIAQTAETVELKVTKGEVSTQISLESGQVSIGANRLVVASDNFSLDATSEIIARGTITSEVGEYKSQISGGGMSFYRDDILMGTIIGAYDFNGWASQRVFSIRSEHTGIALTTISPYGTELGYVLNSGFVADAARGGNAKHVFFGPIHVTDDGSTEASITAQAVRLKVADYLNREPYDDAVSLLGCHDSTEGTPYLLVYGGKLVVQEDFSVYGAKNRVVETENYGAVKLNAMESASAVFSDMGSGVIDETGVSYVYLDPRFLETVDLFCEYQVFITNTSAANVAYVVKETDHFTVYGTPGASFDWIVYARQKDYAQDYLEKGPEKVEIPPEVPNFYGDDNAATASMSYMDEFTDTYDEQAETYLKNYELEVTNYGN